MKIEFKAVLEIDTDEEITLKQFEDFLYDQLDSSGVSVSDVEIISQEGGYGE